MQNLTYTGPDHFGTRTARPADGVVIQITKVDGGYWAESFVYGQVQNARNFYPTYKAAREDMQQSWDYIAAAFV